MGTKRAVPSLFDKSDNTGEFGTKSRCRSYRTMDQEARYRVRLRVAPRIGLTTAETTLTFSHRGRLEAL